jgi:hypothetical protein
MQFPWLEKLASDGHITEAQCASIYATCKEIVKTASESPKWSKPEHEKIFKRIEGGAAAVLNAGVMLMPYALNGFFGSRARSAEMNATLQRISNNRAELIADESITGGHQEKAEARFDEVLKLAPSAAQNKPLMAKILKARLHSGLTTEDVNSLAQIQATYTPSYSTQQELSSKASASMGKTAATILEIAKEAGLWGQAAKTVPGKVLTHALTVTAGPILFGLGRGAVDYLADSRDKKKREQKHIEIFQGILRDDSPETEFVRANPERARQAFQSLTHFSPTTALDPLAARSFIVQAVGKDAAGLFAIPELKSLSEVEKNLKGSGSTPFLKGLREGADVAGFGSALKDTLSAASGPYARSLESSIARGMGLKPEQKRRAR